MQQCSTKSQNIFPPPSYQNDYTRSRKLQLEFSVSLILARLKRNNHHKHLMNTQQIKLLLAKSTANLTIIIVIFIIINLAKCPVI